MRLALLLATCVLTAGCTTTVQGTPSASSTPAPPPRPREVRLDGVDPCSLLTSEQRAALGLESQPRASKPYVGLYRGEVPTCTMRGPSPQNSLLVTGVVTTVGVERWTESDVAATTRSMVVAGFPAVEAAPTRFNDYCNVEVDVASGQLLDVQFGGGSPQAPISQGELCHRAAQSADQMMTTLLGR